MDWENANFTPSIERDPALTEWIRSYSTVISYPAKTVFLTPGTILNGVYYIARGRTCHYMAGADGTEKILYILSSGWFFGETPCSLQEPTGLYSRTDTETTVYLIGTGSYEKMLDRNADFRDVILQSYSKKMLILRHEIENLSFNSCKDRLKRLFCSTADPSRLIDGQWYSLKVRYTQYELSTIVGGARVTIAKLINELCSDGFLRLLNHNIQISAKAYESYLPRR